jgi:hypothetical protein
VSESICVLTSFLASLQSEPGQPYINSNVFATGCHEHANEYWIYLIDARQAMSVLLNEPRFLSITPDTGLLDLTVADTAHYQTVNDFMLQEIRQQNKTDTTQIAVPLVTAVWFQGESHVPSPPVSVLADGTAVTNFPESLALWAAVNDSDRTAVSDAGCSDDDDICLQAAHQADKRYWDGIRAAVRLAEQNRPSELTGPFPYQCKQKTRFGASKDTARINHPFSTADITKALAAIGYTVDFEAGEIIPIGSKDTATEEL